MPAFQSGGDLVIGEGDSIDALQASGAWIRVEAGQVDIHAHR